MNEKLLDENYGKRKENFSPLSFFCFLFLRSATTARQDVECRNQKINKIRFILSSPVSLYPLSDVQASSDINLRVYNT